MISLGSKAQMYHSVLIFEVVYMMCYTLTVKVKFQKSKQKKTFLILIKTIGYIHMGFPSGSDDKESAYSVGDLGLIPELGRSPGGGHGNPLQYSCLENPHGQRSLVGYSPWGHKESDTTEWLSTYIHIKYSNNLEEYKVF